MKSLPKFIAQKEWFIGKLPKGALLIAATVMILPFLYGILLSLMSIRSIGSSQIQLVSPFWQNYINAFRKVNFGLYFFNSLLVSAAVTLGSLFTSILAAYAFARMRFKGKTLLFGITLATLMVPSHITLIPNYLTFSAFGKLDSYWALIFPFLGSGFIIFFLRQNLKTVPLSLDEAATIDGASSWRILWQILVPLIRPSIASMALFTLITQWNSYIWPLIVTNNDKLRTVQIGLATLYRHEIEEALVDWPLVMAGSFITIVPIFVAFLFSEKQLIRGIAAGAIK